jgi:hypothetical protein
VNRYAYRKACSSSWDLGFGVVLMGDAVLCCSDVRPDDHRKHVLGKELSPPASREIKTRCRAAAFVGRLPPPLDRTGRKALATLCGSRPTNTDLFLVGPIVDHTANLSESYEYLHVFVLSCDRRPGHRTPSVCGPGRLGNNAAGQLQRFTNLTSNPANRGDRDGRSSEQ